MSLFKKILFSLFVVVSLGLAVWAYKALQQNKKPSKEVLAVMPDSCILYCSTKNFTDLSIKLNSQNLIFNQWKVLSDVKKLSATIDLYDSLIYNNELIKSIVDDNMIHMGLYNSSTGLHWIVGFSLKELKQETELNQVLEKVLVKKGEHDFVIKDHKLRFDNGVALISDSEELLDKGFGQGNKLGSNRSFMEQLEGIGRNETVRLYVNEELFQKHAAASSPFRIGKLLQAKEVSANVKFNPSEIIVNGNYKPNDEFLQRVIAGQQSGELELFEYLPFGTNCFKAVSISSPQAFQTAMETTKGNNEFWKAINDKALYKVSNDFYGNMDAFAVEFNSFIYKSLAIHVNDTAKAFETLKYLSTADSAFAGVRIFEVEPGLVANAFGGLFEMNALNAFVFNDVLYFTSQMNAAIEIITALQNNSTMKSNEVFMNYVNDNLNEAYNYAVYVAPNMNKSLMKQFLNIKEEHKELFDNLSDANVMVEQKNGVCKFRMQVNYLSPSSGNVPNLLWQCALDSGSTQQPYVFVNHSTKENELVIQDKLKQVYLINSTGKILWKKKINETIRSQVYTVDIFRNKKYQMLFNTDNYLHLIDRNGKYVDGYPIKLSSPATNQISLVDYEGKGDVRVFIACKNHLIYSYTLYGIRSEGFKPYKTEATVKLPVKFVRVGASDYLITIDESGVIHAFSRKGDGRIGFKNRAVERCQDFALVATNNVNRTFLYYVDERNNLINRVSFADKKDVIKLKMDLTDGKVAFQDVNGDQTPDFTVQLFNGLYAYDINGTLIYNNAKLNSTGAVYVNSFDAKKLYFGFDSIKRVIVMSSNANLQLQELSSSAWPGVFDLFKNDKRYMVYVNDGKLLCSQVK